MNQLVYTLDNSIYLNLTNRCPCHCILCIRQGQDTVGDSDILWLKQEPTADEVLTELWKLDLSHYKEIVFCGYGEPMERLDVLLEICRRVKERCRLPIRINTNGLSDLIQQKPTAPLLKGLIDSVSISLNAPNAQRFQEITRSIYGLQSFPALLDFAKSCKESVSQVQFSVVDILSEEEIDECQRLADELGIPLRVRKKI